MAENTHDHQLAKATARLTEYLKKQKMRRTPERVAILEKAFSTGKHFYADELYNTLEADGYHVSRSTLYASLQVLVDAGLLLRHQFGNQPAQYERANIAGGKEPHLHLVCTSCGRVKEQREPALPSEITAHKFPRFQPTHFSLYVYGICSRCQRRMKRQGGSAH